MSHPNSSMPIAFSILERAVDLACRAIPPVWPLASSVAVNPFLGQTGEGLADAEGVTRHPHVRGDELVAAEHVALDEVHLEEVEAAAGHRI